MERVGRRSSSEPARQAWPAGSKRSDDNRFLIIEKGAVVDSLYHYPTHMTFFTTADLLEIGDVPMIVSAEKPKRVDGLDYYRRVADQYELPIKDYEEVQGISGEEGDFRVVHRDRLMSRS